MLSPCDFSRFELVLSDFLTQVIRFKLLYFMSALWPTASVLLLCSFTSDVIAILLSITL